MSQLEVTAEAEVALRTILEAFEHPEELPAKLAKTYLTRERYCSRWSDRNQLLVWLYGFSDAATARTWHSRGRRVTNEQWGNSRPILKPVLRKFPIQREVVRNGEPTGEMEEIFISYLAGFTAWNVYGIEQTEVVNKDLWAKFEPPDELEFLEHLPWLAVADQWGLEVEAFSGGAGWYGFYEHGKRIGLSVADMQTWAHEMIHAAEDRLDSLTKGGGQKVDNEIVAEIGACVLLQLAGMESNIDLRFAYEYVQKYDGDARKTAFLLLGRICNAVSLVLTEAGQLNCQKEAA